MTLPTPPEPDSLAQPAPRLPWRGGAIRLSGPAAAVAVYALAAGLALLAAPVVDSVGGAALDASFKRALGALAATRGLDSAISLAQSSEVSFSFGPGGSLGIGQLLDPVNDLVEQYGSLLLTSTTALGIQQLAMRMGKALGMWLFLPALAVSVAAVVMPGPRRQALAHWARRLFFLALFIRFAIPVTAWIDAVIAKQFLEGDYQQATAVVQSTTENLRQAEAADGEKPWYERYNPVNVVGDRARQVYDALGNVAESIVNLAIYFTVSTIVLPLATLWLLSKVFTSVAAAGARAGATGG
jgi:hypothetical protein